MITNLIFRRSKNVDGATVTETKVIPVSIPFINSGEGWMLLGHTDEIEVHSTEAATTEPPKTKRKTIPAEDKFDSDVMGTAKLVRGRGVIQIVARRGKTTFNQTTPNSVCISDELKNMFFNSCRQAFGSGTSKFFFRPEDKYYDYWNSVIDREYTSQKEHHLKYLV